MDYKESVETKRQFYLDNFYHFAKYCLGYNLMTPYTHGPITDALEAETKRKLIAVPRGTFKSSIATVAYPMWLLEKDPNLRILIDSEKYENSKNFLREIKAQYETNAEFIETFGNRKGSLWNEGEAIVSSRTRPKKEPSIACSGIGAGKTSQHYDCLVEGSMIYTSNGFKKIEDIKVRNRVLGSDGKFHSVVATKNAVSTKNIVSIRSMYQPAPVELTEDHRIYIYRDGNFQWEEAKNIRLTDKLCFPKISGLSRQISRTNEAENFLLTIEHFWRFIGYWLAEGCASPGSQIRLSFGYHEQDIADDCCDIIESIIGKRPTQRPSGRTIVVGFSDQNIKSILNRFGTHAHNKHLPPFALNARTVYQRQLVRGYWLGDGCRTGKNVAFVSISKDLLFGFQMVLAALDIPSTFTRLKKAKDEVIIVGWKCKNRETFSLTSTSNRLKSLLDLPEDGGWEPKPIHSFFTDKFWVVPVTSIETRENESVVYDIQVADVHSFVTMIGTVHNCIIADDLCSYVNTKNPDVAAKVLDHYKLYQSLLDPGGIIVVIGTRYSELDVIGFIIENELGIENQDLNVLKKLYG